MTTEEKAKAYAENIPVTAATWGMRKSVIADEYLAGATEALASQWVSAEERLPEDNTLVAVWINSTIFTDFCENGKWHHYGVRFWLPIPPLKASSFDETDK